MWVNTCILSAYSCILLHALAYSLHTLCILSAYFSQVLLEWCDSDSEGGGQREWVDLTNSDKFLSVYLEQDLLWARRVLPSEQQRAVAWPAKVSGTFNCKFWADVKSNMQSVQTSTNWACKVLSLRVVFSFINAYIMNAYVLLLVIKSLPVNWEKVRGILFCNQ